MGENGSQYHARAKCFPRCLKVSPTGDDHCIASGETLRLARGVRAEMGVPDLETSYIEAACQTLKVKTGGRNTRKRPVKDVLTN